LEAAGFAAPLAETGEPFFVRGKGDAALLVVMLLDLFAPPNFGRIPVASIAEHASLAEGSSGVSPSFARAYSNLNDCWKRILLFYASCYFILKVLFFD